MSDRKLFTPYRLGNIELQNRVVMAPMTRNRANNPDFAPNDIMVEYYRQRASAGLIITEGIPVSDQGRGYAFTSGVYSDAQAAGWKKVTQAVHQAGGRIYAQIWHCGRINHSSLRADRSPPVGPSSITAQAKTMGLNLETGAPAFLPCEPPHALTIPEIKAVVADFVLNAKNAIAAGFDGVEIHGANGYLLDEFRCPFINDRQDEYGGSLENRCRLHLEIAQAVSDAVGAERVAMRLSPYGAANDMKPDPDPIATYGYLARECEKIGLAYLHFYDQGMTWIHEAGHPLLKTLRESFSRALILCGGFDGDKAEAALAAGSGDLIAFGKPYVSNPDLVTRLQTAVELAAWNTKTFYGGGAAGYTDYPALVA